MNKVYLLSEGKAPINWVFIHGWGSDNTLWESFRVALHASTNPSLSGAHFAIDLPGFADAALSQPDSLNDYLSAVERELPENCILLGWSLGGMIATQLASRNTDKLVALLTVGSNPCFVVKPDWPSAMSVDTFEAFFEGFTQSPVKAWKRFCGLQAKGSLSPKSLLTLLKQQSSPTDKTVEAWTSGLRWLRDIDNRHALKVLTVPSLHLFGQGDSLVPDAVVDAVAHLGVSQAALVNTGGHCPHITQAEAVVKRIEVWLSHLSVFRESPQINKLRIAKSFAGAAHTYDASAALQKEVARDLLNFGMPVIEHSLGDHSRVLDLGCGTGYITQQLVDTQGGCSHQSIVALDIAEPMVKLTRSRHDCMALTADAEFLPLADDCFRAVISSLAVQWFSDLSFVVKEAARVLDADGYFLFSTLGPQTLIELKTSWASVNGFQHVNEFKSVEDVEQEVIQSGLLIERIESFTKVMFYPEVLPILRDLKAIGAHNMNAGQNPGLTSAGQFRALESRYEQYRNEAGMLPVSYDVILVVAKKPHSTKV